MYMVDSQFCAWVNHGNNWEETAELPAAPSGYEVRFWKLYDMDKKAATVGKHRPCRWTYTLFKAVMPLPTTSKRPKITFFGWSFSLFYFFASGSWKQPRLCLEGRLHFAHRIGCAARGARPPARVVSHARWTASNSRSLPQHDYVSPPLRQRI